MLSALPACHDVVLIVDDTPANLAYLSDALYEAGYKVLVAIDGATALERLKLVTPDIILLDAMMPGMDGFQTCEMMKQDKASDIPVIFMTGLIETEHVLRAFERGAVDYVTKPVRQEEMLARIRTHVARARMLKRAHTSIESCGRASFTVDAGGNITWQTPKAREWLAEYLDDTQLMRWDRLRIWLDELGSARGGAVEAAHFSLQREHGRLNVHYAGVLEGGERLLLLEEQRDEQVSRRLMQRFGLTLREAEVLTWLAGGKTNRDIGDILGMSPRTVNKHLERIYVKLGVETRAAAAAIAINMVNSPHIAVAGHALV